MNKVNPHPSNFLPPRGPLAHIILSATGQDVRRCIQCYICEDIRVPGMDLSVCEVMQAAARDHKDALRNQTIWLHAPMIESVQECCTAKIDMPAVLSVLRREAKIRGYTP
jgi:hypothetical protein